MRRADFDDTAVYKRLGDRVDPDLSHPYLVLYQHIATGDCFQVSDYTLQYRQTQRGHDINDTYKGPWHHFQDAPER